MANLRLLNAVTAANGKPSGATAGFALKRGRGSGQEYNQGFNDGVRRWLLIVWDSAGSGVMDFKLRMWGYLDKVQVGDAAVNVARWCPLGTGADADKGTLNAGAAMGETNTDDIGHAEVIENLMGFDRVYCEVVSINGTGTAANAVLVELP